MPVSDFGSGSDIYQRTIHIADAQYAGGDRKHGSVMGHDCVPLNHTVC